MGAYLRMVEAGISIPIGQQILQLANQFQNIEIKAALSIVGWVLILVNSLLGAEGAVEAISTRWYMAREKVLSK